MVSRQAAQSGDIPLDEGNTRGDIPVIVRFARQRRRRPRGRSPGKPLLATDAAATAVQSVLCCGSVLALFDDTAGPAQRCLAAALAASAFCKV
jgi:hypothetical protein